MECLYIFLVGEGSALRRNVLDRGHGSNERETSESSRKMENTFGQLSTDDSDDTILSTIPETCPVSAGQLKGKTSRWNRPPPPRPMKCKLEHQL